MTTDECKAEIAAAGGIIGDVIRRFLDLRLKPGIRDYLEKRFRRGCVKFLEICREHGFTAPCQELYDLALADREHATFYSILKLVRFMDAETHTHAVDPLTGLPFNDSFNQSETECDAFFASVKTPLERAQIGFVITKAMRGLDLFGCTDSTKGQNLRMFRLFAEYCRANCGGWCSAEAAAGFIRHTEQLHSGKAPDYWKIRLARRAAMIASEILRTGSFSRWSLNEMIHAMPGGLDTARKWISECCRIEGKSLHTLQSIDYGFRKFTELACISSAEELKETDAEKTAAAVARIGSVCTTAGSALSVARYMRTALRLLFKGGFTRKDLSCSVMLPRQNRDSVIGYLSDEDEARLVSWLEEGNESLRNRAVILLALRLGLRSSDIRALRFEDIDWKKEKISIVQRKTGEPLTLPLLPEVGNAVWDYITKERPRVSCPCVFIRAQAPYSPLTDCYGFISCILKKLKITPVNRGTLGPHVLRHTLIKDLLHQEIPHQHITDVLGHRSRDSDRSYYAIAEEKLRECALDLSLIGMPVWMKGADHE